MMAVGVLVAGDPLVGVWLSSGLACAAVCWMLQAWLPARWAFWGGLMPVLRFGILANSYMSWSRHYFGGMVAVMGGALMFGALRRIHQQPRVRDAGLLGIGLLVLANTRPFEGLVASLPVAVVLLAQLRRQSGTDLRRFLARVVVPIAACLTVGFAWMGYYNYRVTGNPLRLPYVHHRSLYNPVPNFVLGTVQPAKEYRHADLERFYEGKRLESPYAETRTVPGWLYHTVRKFAESWLFFLGPALTLPWMRISHLLRDRWSQFALAGLAAAALAFALIVWRLFVYLAPVACLLIYVALGLRSPSARLSHQRPSCLACFSSVLCCWSV